MDTTPPPMLSEREAHENWIRVHAIKLAIKRSGYRSLEESITDAKRIEQYILRPNGCRILRLKRKRGK